MPANAHPSIKAGLIGKSKLMGQKPADFHDILRLLDGASLLGCLGDLMSRIT